MANISLEYLCRIFPLNICDGHAGLFPEYFHGIFVTAPPASPTYKASGQHCTVKPLQVSGKVKVRVSKNNLVLTK